GVRFTNPTSGRDALATMRTEMHRLRPGTRTATRRTVGSAVWQVYRGRGAVQLDGRWTELDRGDAVAIPSWCPYQIEAHTQLDLFTFSDAPVYEALHLSRTHTDAT
ncbi:MAG: cupin domain-containing protein, partial [Actinomycetes bacterium]